MVSVVGDSTLEDVEADELPAGLDASDLTPVEAVTHNLRGLFTGFTKFDDAYIVGAVSDLSPHSEHLYFSVTAAHTDSKINCIVWASNREDVGVDVRPDTLVAVKGTLNFFEGGGYPSLEVREAHLVGESAYWRRIERLRERLETEGLFEAERRDPLPRFPATVGVVTAAGSDAEGDLLDGIHGRYPDVDVLVHDSAVQGADAPAELTAAIEAVDESAADVLVVARGGGSETALRTFNEESVVRAVANAETPTVSAIGHEADQPLVDRVADVRVKTPTAAGEAVVDDKEQHLQGAERATHAVATAYRTQVRRWLDEYRDGIDGEYAALCEQWLDGRSSAVDEAYANRAEGWLQDRRRAIESSYAALATEWIDVSYTVVQRETARLEREYRFEQEKSGLRRRNAALLALVVVLAVLLLAVLAFAIGIV